MVNVCQKTSESIDLWSKKRRESRKEFMAFTASQAEVESSELQKTASLWLIGFQVLVIFFTVAVIVLSDRANLYFTGKRLSEETQSLEAVKVELETKVSKLQDENEYLRKKLSTFEKKPGN